LRATWWQLAAGGGYRKGSDESQKMLFRTAVGTSCAPACGKLLVLVAELVFCFKNTKDL